MAGQYARHFHRRHPPRLIQGVDRGAGQAASRRIADGAQDRKRQPPRGCHLSHGATFKIDGDSLRLLPQAMFVSDGADHRVSGEQEIDREPGTPQQAQQARIAVIDTALMQDAARHQRGSGVQAGIKPTRKAETDQRSGPVIGQIFGHFPGTAGGAAANCDGTAGTLRNSRFSDHANDNTKTRNSTLPPQPDKKRFLCNHHTTLRSFAGQCQTLGGNT